MSKKYRGKYTNARNCKHAKSETAEYLMGAVEVKESCPIFGASKHKLAVSAVCQGCAAYEKQPSEEEQ